MKKNSKNSQPEAWVSTQPKEIVAEGSVASKAMAGQSVTGGIGS